MKLNSHQKCTKLASKEPFTKQGHREQCQNKILRDTKHKTENYCRTAFFLPSIILREHLCRIIEMGVGHTCGQIKAGKGSIESKSESCPVVRLIQAEGCRRPNQCAWIFFGLFYFYFSNNLKQRVNIPAKWLDFTWECLNMGYVFCAGWILVRRDPAN